MGLRTGRGFQTPDPQVLGGGGGGHSPRSAGHRPGGLLTRPGVAGAPGRDGQRHLEVSETVGQIVFMGVNEYFTKHTWILRKCCSATTLYQGVPFLLIKIRRKI